MDTGSRRHMAVGGMKCFNTDGIVGGRSGQMGSQTQDRKDNHTIIFVKTLFYLLRRVIASHC